MNRGESVFSYGRFVRSHHRLANRVKGVLTSAFWRLRSSTCIRLQSHCRSFADFPSIIVPVGSSKCIYPKKWIGCLSLARYWPGTLILEFPVPRLCRIAGYGEQISGHKLRCSFTAADHKLEWFSITAESNIEGSQNGKLFHENLCARKRLKSIIQVDPKTGLVTCL